MANNRAKFVIEEYGSGYGWVLKVRGQAVARSARTYTHKTQVRKAIESFTNHAATATVVDE